MTLEVSAYWHDDVTVMRLRPVRFPARAAQSPHHRRLQDRPVSGPEEFEKAVADYADSDQQAAPVHRFALEHDFNDPAFVFIVQQKDPHTWCRSTRSTPEWIEYGRAKNRKAIDLYAKCMETDTWPGHGDEVFTVSMPRWLRKQLESENDAA